MRGVRTAHDDDWIVPFDVRPGSTRLGAPADQAARDREDLEAFAKYDAQRAATQAAAAARDRVAAIKAAAGPQSITSYRDERRVYAPGPGDSMRVPGKHGANQEHVQRAIHARTEHNNRVARTRT